MIRPDPVVRSAVVIGAGVAGLACAIDLAAAGWKVMIIERARAPGGKIRTLCPGGLPVDAGPTVLTMRWVFDDLFRHADRRLEDYVTFERAEILARHGWQDGSRLDLFADVDRTAEAIGSLSGLEDAKAYRGFCDYARRIYEAVEEPFLRSQRPTLWSVLRREGRSSLSALAHVDAHRTMWRALEGQFRDPRLRQLFGRYATYCGSSPFAAPATLNVIAHVESLGVYRVRGGMEALGGALHRLAGEVGVRFRFGTEVRKIVVRSGRATGVLVDDDQVIEADAVVSNADVGALSSGLLGSDAATAVKHPPAAARSFSAVTWALVGLSEGFPLLQHNVLFSSDARREFSSLEGERELPVDPTVYVCAQDRGDQAEGGGEERFLVVANAPATGDVASDWDDEKRQRCEESVWRTMRACGLHLSSRASIRTLPTDYHRLYPGTGGALYGARSQGLSTLLSRQGARTKIGRLYLAGGSVHPGPGVPMAALSGRLAAAALRSDLDSIARSSLVGTSGSISTG